MILEFYLDPWSGSMGFEVYEAMNEIEKHTTKRFSREEEQEIMNTYWQEGMVNLADFMNEKQINEALEVG